MFVKWFFILGTISSIMMIAYYVVTLCLKYKVSKQETKTTLSDFYPKSFIDWYKLNESIGQSKNRSIFIQIYYKLLLTYVCLLFFLSSNLICYTYLKRVVYLIIY